MKYLILLFAGFYLGMSVVMLVSCSSPEQKPDPSPSVTPGLDGPIGRTGASEAGPCQADGGEGGIGVRSDPCDILQGCDGAAPCNE